ncbi:hypothetical protein ACGFJT_37295 [Actinomadura geliboluensis]|uniref:hypothetical protein n=1 Tax=Actinomadura geliboluensis TaxID=882440 RepID=UPI0037212A84
MPKGRPTPSPPVDLRELLKRLQVMHEDADDPHRDLWPDPEDVLGTLIYTRLHHRALRPETSKLPQRADQATLRLTIIRTLRPMLDREERFAIDDARAAGATWASLAPHLGVALPGSAKNRHRRLVGSMEDPQRRRTPEAGRAAELAQLRERSTRGRVAATVARHQHQLVQAARELVAHAGDLAINDECESIWLAGVEGCLAIERPGDPDQERLANYLGITIHEIVSYAASEGIPPARTPQAQAALDQAAVLRDELHRWYEEA